MNAVDPIQLAQRLVRLDTRNPPGGERECARLVGGILEDAGFAVSFHEFAPGRASLTARLAGDGGAPICFSGHLDTVTLGEAPWSFDPLGGEIQGGRLLGRGASDMKGGVAALVAAAVNLARRPRGRGGVLAVLTAGEETGCDGSAHLASLPGVLGRAGALLVAEPTSNHPMLGHKGAAWFTAVVRGKSAHGSMPHLGDNAIVKAARAVLRLEEFDFGLAPHPQMGPPTLNVGVIHGGSKPNLVPDRTEFTLDLRTLPGQDHAGLREIIARRLGPEVEIEPGVAAEAVWTPPEGPWAVQVFDIMEGVLGSRPEPQGLSYFTDAPNLAGAMGGPPIIILGPGEAEQAHQTDEFCRIDRIAQAAEAYLEIGVRWLGL